jgi:hypothetical protein
LIVERQRKRAAVSSRKLIGPDAEASTKRKIEHPSWRTDCESTRIGRNEGGGRAPNRPSIDSHRGPAAHSVDRKHVAVDRNPDRLAQPSSTRKARRKKRVPDQSDAARYCSRTSWRNHNLSGCRSGQHRPKFQILVFDQGKRSHHNCIRFGLRRGSMNRGWKHELRQHHSCQNLAIRKSRSYNHIVRLAKHLLRLIKHGWLTLRKLAPAMQSIAGLINALEIRT